MGGVKGTMEAALVEVEEESKELIESPVDFFLSLDLVLSNFLFSRPCICPT